MRNRIIPENVGFDEKLVRYIKMMETSRTSIYYRGPWNAILNIIFPASQGYMVTPFKEVATSNLYFDIAFRVTTYPGTMPGFCRSHVYVEFRQAQLWPDGVKDFENYIKLELQKRMDKTFEKVVYWITCVGLHWRFGRVTNRKWVRKDEERWVPLIEWQHTLSDETAFHHLCALAREVEQHSSVSQKDTVLPSPTSTASAG